MGEDEVLGGWQIDPGMRVQMRLDHVRKLLDEGDWSEAVLEVEELLDEEPDHPDALFLLAESLLELGDAEGAAQAYEHHLEVATGQGRPRSPAALCGLAVARFELCDPPSAVESARESIRLAPDLAEAHYYLGLALERMGKKSEAIAAIVAAHRLDPAAYPLPLQGKPEQWKEAVEQALAAIPPALRDFWRNVPIRLEELPPLDELKLADPPITPTVSGLYEGTPPEEGDPTRVKPRALRLYTSNLARLGEWPAVVDEIARTLTHEAADWVGEE